jgi:hypothetical protein
VPADPWRGGPGERAAGGGGCAVDGPAGAGRRGRAHGRDGRRRAGRGTAGRRGDGVPRRLRTPLAGATIAVWQTNANGEYGPGQGTAGERCCYLGAALRTDERGRYRIETVKPGHYKGEAQPPPAHIHFEVKHPDATGVLTELLFEGDPHLGPDPPGVVVRPARARGSDPPALHARFDIVLGP